MYVSLIFFFLAGLSCTSGTRGPAVPGPVSSAAAPVPAGPLVLLHTNDIHSNYLPTPASWLEGKPLIGGFEAMDAHVRAIRRREGEDRVLLLNAGDLLTGTPLTPIEVDGARGGAMIQFIEALDYDASTLGNHEFDQGLDNLATLIRSSDVPFVVGNLVATDGGPPVAGVRPDLVVERGGVRVGLLGAITEELPSLTPRGTMDRLRLLPLTETLSTQVARLDPVTDLLVLVSHLGIETDRAVAAAVPGIDLIVGGHSHTRLVRPERVGDTWIVHAGNGARSIGEVRLTVQDDTIATIDSRLVDLVPGLDPEGASPEVGDAVARWKDLVDAEFGRQVGVLPVDLPAEDERESALGNWVTDILRLEVGADVAFYNAGGLRADLRAGPVTRLDLFQVLPFENAVVSFTARGSDLLHVLTANARVLHAGGDSYMSTSGVEFWWSPGPSGPEVVRATVGGAPLQPERDYRVVTNSYLVDQWATWLPSAPRDVVVHPGTELEVAIRAMSAGFVQTPPVVRAHGQESSGER